MRNERRRNLLYANDNDQILREGFVWKGQKLYRADRYEDNVLQARVVRWIFSTDTGRGNCS